MTEADAALVLEWRNSERVRKAMYTHHVISLEEHMEWLGRTLPDERYSHLVCEYRGEAFGVVVLTLVDESAARYVWSFYVGDINVPRGSGSVMGYLALQYVFDKRHGHKLVGEAIAGNGGSIKYHERLGFSREGRLVEHIFRDGKYEDVITFAMFDRTWSKMRDRLSKALFAQTV